jgi:hypothetical protein
MCVFVSVVDEQDENGGIVLGRCVVAREYVPIPV